MTITTLSPIIAISHFFPIFYAKTMLSYVAVLIARGETAAEHRRHGALPHAPFSRQNQDFVADLLEALLHQLDAGVGPRGAGGADLLVGAPGAGRGLACVGAVGAGAIYKRKGVNEFLGVKGGADARGCLWGSPRCLPLLLSVRNRDVINQHVTN